MEDSVLDRLLEALEKTPPLSGHPILAELVQGSKEPLEGQWKYPFHLVRHAAIELIKSGVFVGDNLRGRRIASIPPKVKTYPINDPEELVWLIALPLTKDVEKEISQEVFDFHKREITRSFGRIVADISHLSGLIEPFAKPKTKEKIREIQTALASLKKKLLANLPKGFFKIEDPIDYMVDALQKHVPEAPEETIAKRVVDILRISEIGEVSYKTILQRINRRKQETT
jgi:hypothetical protein